MTSIAISAGVVVLLVICWRMAYRAGYDKGHEAGMSDNFQLWHGQKTNSAK